MFKNSLHKVKSEVSIRAAAYFFEERCRLSCAPKNDVKQFKVYRTAGEAEGIGIKCKGILFQ